jgi:K(+)-stimulated pyrophosphate-energized sodium pump
MGLVVVGLGLLDISFWYVLLNSVIPAEAMDPTHKLSIITTTMLTFGMGASTQAYLPVWVVVSIPKLPMWEPTW